MLGVQMRPYGKDSSIVGSVLGSLFLETLKETAALELWGWEYQLLMCGPTCRLIAVPLRGVPSSMVAGS